MVLTHSYMPDGIGGTGLLCFRPPSKTSFDPAESAAVRLREICKRNGKTWQQAPSSKLCQRTSTGYLFQNPRSGVTGVRGQPTKLRLRCLIVDLNLATKVFEMATPSWVPELRKPTGTSPAPTSCSLRTFQSSASPSSCVETPHFDVDPRPGEMWGTPPY